MKKILAILLVCSLALSMSGCDLVNNLLDQALQNFVGGFTGGDHTRPTIPVPKELLDLSQAKVVSGFYQDYYVFTGVTEAQVQAFAQTLLDAGYIRQSMTMELDNCPEANYMYRVYHTNANGPAPMAEFCFYKDTLVLCLDEIGMNLGEMWQAAGVEEAVFGEDFPLFTQEELALPDWEQAVEVVIGDYTCKQLTGVPEQQAINYGQWLYTREGYWVDGWVGSEDGLSVAIRDAQEQYSALVWAKDTLLLVSNVGEFYDLDLRPFWAHLGADVLPGSEYLAELMIFLPGGNGSSTGTVMWSYAYGCTVEDYERLKGKVAELGFVEEPKETIDGDYREYVVVKYLPVGQRIFLVYYQIILDGDYLELELDYSVHEGHHKD